MQVLQYELKSAGGDGKTFVRDVKNYVKTYSRNRKKIPPEHVLVYDEAQRAFDAAMVRCHAQGRQPQLRTTSQNPSCSLSLPIAFPNGASSLA